MRKAVFGAPYRFRLSHAILLSLLGVTIAAFATAVQYSQGKKEHSVADVRKAFGEQGIRLNYAGDALGTVTILGAHPRPWQTNDLYVYVAGGGRIDWGEPDAGAYEVRLGNVLVHDGRGNREAVRAVEAAVASLRSES